MPSHRFQWNLARLKGIPNNSKSQNGFTIAIFRGGGLDHPLLFLLKFFKEGESEEWSSQQIFQFKQLERRSLKKYRCDAPPNMNTNMDYFIWTSHKISLNTTKNKGKSKGLLNLSNSSNSIVAAQECAYILCELYTGMSCNLKDNLSINLS